MGKGLHRKQKLPLPHQKDSERGGTVGYRGTIEENETRTKYRIRIEDRTLIEYGIYPGDELLIEEGMVGMWSEVEYIGKLVVMAGPRGIFIGRYAPPYLVRSQDRISILSEMEIVGVVWRVMREI